MLGYTHHPHLSCNGWASSHSIRQLRAISVEVQRKTRSRKQTRSIKTDVARKKSTVDPLLIPESSHWQHGRFGIDEEVQHDICMHKEYFDWLCEKLGFQHVNDCYQLTSSVISANNGHHILRSYSESVPLALKAVYPDVEWQPWIFGKVPQGFWKDLRHHRDYYEWLGDQLDILHHEQWYSLTYATVKKYYGAGIMFANGDSPTVGLLRAFPEIKWQPWRFERVPARYWDSVSNQREYFDWLEGHLELKSVDDWHGVTQETVISNYGNGLLFTYNTSLASALMTVYPEVEWQPWRFERVPTGFWDTLENQRKYMDWLAEQLEIYLPEQWHLLTVEILGELHGRGILLIYDNSMRSLLSSVFPDTTWHAWQFTRVPHNHWESGENCKEYVEWLEDRLQIDSVEGWYGVTTDLITSQQGGTIANTPHRSLMQLLRKSYKEESWDLDKWTDGHTSRVQSLVSAQLGKIFPDMEVEDESGVPLRGFAYGRSGMRFDLWIPHENAVVEYQGVQHYLENSFVHQEMGVKEQYMRDLQKQKACEVNGIRLIEVPYWWGYEVDKLQQEVLYRVSYNLCNVAEKKFLQLGLKKEAGLPESLLYVIHEEFNGYVCGGTVP